ncbi:hypothetical protein ACIQCJ_22135 [Streptomyces sp. NPDC093221]|uniref:hypothetical protein n=1 Tax=Streptomyces sp. NPDC093221 TaxID=3366032 RepID=UPI0037F3AF5A
MSFFQDVPEPPTAPEPEPRPRPPWERSVYVLPASVPGDVVLLRSDRAAVWIGGLRAYPNGFVFHLRAVLRRTPANGAWLGNPLDGRSNPLRPPEPQSNLRLGLRYADGRRVATQGGMPVPWPGDDDTEAIRLISQGGGGSGLTWEASFWTYPLPPDGPVTVFTSWLDAGVREASVELDGAAIRAAGGRAVRLWPQDEDPEDEDGYSYVTRTLTVGDAEADGDGDGDDDPETEPGTAPGA